VLVKRLPSKGACREEVRNSRSKDLVNSRVRVAFQGEKGSYSHQACEKYFGERIAVKPCRTLRDVFRTVETRKAAFGIVPVENSYEGNINETHDLLALTPLNVRGEVQVRVRHCLIAGPGANLSRIRTVYSHPQALAQCAKYLRAHKLEGIPYYDTAGSVKLVKSMRSSKLAAIASRRAAQLYDMQVVSEGVEDSGANYTRFFVLGGKTMSPTGDDKTSVIFGVEHKPGSLYGALRALSSRRINLTKIESRPVKNTPWQYNFFADFQGHVEDQVCREALKSLRAKSTFVKVLGSYPRETSI
jgi:prephenate dehydratase